MWQEEVQGIGPYDFDRALDRLARDPLHAIDRKERKITVPIYEPKLEIATVQAIGTTTHPLFIVSGAHEETKDACLRHIFTVFQWKTSLTDIHRHFQETSLKDIFLAHLGTPIILDFSPYSCIVKSIIHQQLNIAFAYVLTERFVHTYGMQKEGVWFYPSPEKVAGLTVDALRELQFSQRKAEYIIEVSKQITTGELDLSVLQTASDKEVVQTLTKVRGIGPWTAQSFLLFGLGRPNLFPKADIGIQHAIKKLFQLDKKPTYEQMDTYSKEWQPYLSYASLYLWRSIEIEKEKSKKRK